MLIKVEDKDLVYTQNKEYVLTSVVSDHGIYERKCEYNPNAVVPSTYHLFDGYYWELKLIVNSRSNALKILEILDEDNLRHRELNKDNIL